MDNKEIVGRIDTVLERYNQWKQRLTDDNLEVYTLLSDTIRRLAPLNSEYYQQYMIIKKSPYRPTLLYADPEIRSTSINNLASLLRSLRFEYEHGYLGKIEDIANSNAFKTVLDDAEYLLSKDYKDPAAFMIGCVLESHIKRLCLKSNIPLYYSKDGEQKKHKTQSLNQALYTNKKCPNATYQQIVGWLGIRNDADHHDWGNYTKDNVEDMLRGVRTLIKQYP